MTLIGTLIITHLKLLLPIIIIESSLFRSLYLLGQSGSLFNQQSNHDDLIAVFNLTESESTLDKNKEATSANVFDVTLPTYLGGAPKPQCSL